jgi:hypothetical protein
MSDIEEQIIFDLQGTGNTLEQVLEQHNALHLQNDAQFLHNLDNQIFECCCCGWWCDLGEVASHPDSGEDVCSDCYEEEENE